MTTLAAETWTGSNGAAWPAQWTATRGTATIQGNRGRTTTTTATFDTTIRTLNIADSTNTDLTVTAYPTTTPFQYAFARINGVGSTGTQWVPSSGYQLWLTPSGGNVVAELVRYSGGAATTILGPTTTTVPYSTTNGFALRLQRIGSTVRYKVWAGNAAEPGAWGGSYTDASPLPAGKVALLNTSNNDGVARSIDWDNLTVSDGADVPTNLDNLRVGAGTVLLRVGANAASKAYIGATQVWP